MLKYTCPNFLLKNLNPQEKMCIVLKLMILWCLKLLQKSLLVECYFVTVSAEHTKRLKRSADYTQGSLQKCTGKHSINTPQVSLTLITKVICLKNNCLLYKAVIIFIKKKTRNVQTHSIAKFERIRCS